MKVNPAALTDMREARGLTKSALAVEAGMSLSYVSELESGAKPGSAKAIHLLAKALKCNALTLMADPNDRRDVLAATLDPAA